MLWLPLVASAELSKMNLEPTNRTLQQMGTSFAWYEIVLNAIIAAATALYTASCISHIAAAWVLRGNFNLAVRSPLLAIMSGSVAAWVSSFAILRLVFFPDQLEPSVEGGVAEVVHIPMVLWGFTLPYAVRGVRLIVMYNPHMRGRWGRILNEPPMIRKLVALFFVTEAIAWSAGLVYGVDRVASLTYIAIGISILFTLAICMLLIGALRRTDDMSKMSLEIQWVGFFALLSLGMGFVTTALPASFQGYWVMLFMVARFHFALFYTNIQPTRTLLRRQSDYRRKGFSVLFPYVPCGSRTKVAIEETIQSPRSIHFDDTLGRILNFQPLLQAFEEFCRKALCSESIQFLVAVKEYKESLRVQDELDATNPFEKLSEIIDKFVRDRSPFEVNVGSNVKCAVLKMADAANFMELSLEERSQILEGAKHEVGKMLNDNLYKKFLATEEYAQINEMMFSTAVGHSWAPK